MKAFLLTNNYPVSQQNYNCKCSYIRVKKIICRDYKISNFLNLLEKEKVNFYFQFDEKYLYV